MSSASSSSGRWPGILSNSRVLALGVLAFGLAISALASNWQARRNRELVELHFANVARSAVDRLSEHLVLCEYRLRGSRAATLMVGIDQVTREGFARYIEARDLAHELPGMQGVGLVRRSGEHFVVQYIEPLSLNQQTAGLDFATQPSFREAAVFAMRSGSAGLSAPVALPDPSGRASAPPPTSILLVPIYDSLATHGTEREREANALGWVYAPLVLNELFEAGGTASDFALAASDTAHSERPFFATRGFEAPAALGISERRELSIYGRTWSLQLKATPAFVTRLGLVSPLQVGLVGGAVAVAAAALGCLLARIAQRQRQQQLEQARRAAAAQRDLQAILDAVPSLISYWDRDLKNRFANRAHETWFQRDPAEFPGLPLRELLGETPFGELEQVLKAALSGESQVTQLELRVPGYEEPRQALVHCFPDSVQGEVGGFYLFVHDNTPQHSAMQLMLLTLCENNSLQTTLHEFAIVSSMDPKGKILEVNDNFCTISGYSRDELVGKQHTTTDAGVHDAEFWKRMWSTVGNGEPWRALVCNRNKSGDQYCIDTLIAPIRNPLGTIETYISIGFDVTAAQKAQTELRTAMQNAEAANRAKSEFLANISHEIRTPMNAVIGVSYLLENTALDSEQASLLSKVQVASKGLLSLLNDVLDLSKIEAGELSLERSRFSLSHMLTDLESVFSLQARSKSIQFELRTQGALPNNVEGDATRVNQIVTNLLGNALKFTEQGGVTLSVRTVQQSRDAALLRFEVQDTGIGMSPEEQARLFTPFQQADASTTRRFGGTGLGLSIVKRLVALMSGKIGLSSEPGVGTTFWVELPLLLATGPALPAERTPSIMPKQRALLGAKVLVVDDSDINLFVARRILQQQGASVTTASNGREALEHLSRSAEAFDVVLMDIQMPVMDGHTATRRIRSELGLRSLPIVALTADARKSERDHALQSGINDFLTKPFDAATLVRTLVRFVGLRPEPVAATSESRLLAAAAPAAPLYEGWPRIEGVAIEEVHDRLSGDLGLFRLLVTQLVSDFLPLPEFPRTGSPREVAEYGRLMHKLRGGSGQLGCKSIQDLSRRIEALCRDGDAERAGELVARLGLELRELQLTVEQLFGTEQPASSASGAALNGAERALESAEVSHLLSLLRDQNLAGLDEARKLAPRVKSWLGSDDFQAFERSLDTLQFARAAEILAARRAS